jgi:hypothetical protein
LSSASRAGSRGTIRYFTNRQFVHAVYRHFRADRRAASLQTLRKPLFSNYRYMSRRIVNRSQIQPNHQASDAILHSTNLEHSIQTIKNCEQRRNDLSVILICFGHVLRRAKPLKAALL